MDWENIRKEYESSSITLKDLAEKHDIKLGTLKSRKSREGWGRDAPEKDATKTERVATKREKVATQKQKGAVPKSDVVESLIESEELTDKQGLFAMYFVKYFNATKAYQKAYQCSYEVANKNAYTLMVNHGIKQEIVRLKKAIADGIMLDGSAVLQKYIDIAFTDITDFVKWNNSGDYVTLKPLYEIDGSLISEVGNTENGIKIKLADKMKALDFLSKYMDLLSENDRRKLQEEKLKVDIDKTKAEVDRLTTDEGVVGVTIVDEMEGNDEW